jgi:ribosomal protein S18 acetylase RimI-like enzyme
VPPFVRFNDLADGTTQLVAFDGDRRVGALLVLWTGSVHDRVRSALGDTPELFRLRLSPELRNRGVAQLLLLAAEEVVRRRDKPSVGLAVGVHNTPARRLFAKAGYTDAGFETFDSPFGLDDDGRPYHHDVTYLTKSLDEPALVAVVA